MADVNKVKASDGTIYDINDVNDYTKDETDALLAGKADVGVSYTKAEDDALLAAKADSSSVDSALALKANVVDVYSKTEADNLLASKADTGVSYTKAEDDALLADKADVSSLDNYTLKATFVQFQSDVNVEFQNRYTKTEDDTLLGTKANSSDVYAKTDVYTKAEVDALIGGLSMFPLLDFANPIASFTTNTELNYTVPEDCWMVIATCDAASTNFGKVVINGLGLTVSKGGNGGACCPPLLRVKQGDIITTQNYPQAYGGIYFLRERS